jgi:hypothetical protein
VAHMHRRVWHCNWLAMNDSLHIEGLQKTGQSSLHTIVLSLLPGITRLFLSRACLSYRSCTTHFLLKVLHKCHAPIVIVIDPHLLITSH